MSRVISRAESWETVYRAFQDVNFSAFDYNAVKQSLIDYLRLYFPESFNDFIETSEFIAVIETFAYIAELMAYRYDLDAHENFITLAQRKESVLRLAKLLSYTSSRNLPARGFVKVTSVSTTENVFDTNGVNLANTTVTWNDQANPNWKEQFILVMNRILAQDFGTVSPTDRKQLNDVVFELYPLNNVPPATGVYRYSAAVTGNALAMEAVPAAFDDLGPVEKRPAINQAFVMMYASDGLGDGSETTWAARGRRSGRRRFWTCGSISSWTARSSPKRRCAASWTTPRPSSCSRANGWPSTANRSTRCAPNF